MCWLHSSLKTSFSQERSAVLLSHKPDRAVHPRRRSRANETPTTKARSAACPTCKCLAAANFTLVEPQYVRECFGRVAPSRSCFHPITRERVLKPTRCCPPQPECNHPFAYSSKFPLQYPPSNPHSQRLIQSGRSGVRWNVR